MLLASSYSDGDDSLGLRVADDGDVAVAMICRWVEFDSGDPTGVDGDAAVLPAVTDDRTEHSHAPDDDRVGTVGSPQKAGRPSG